MLIFRCNDSINEIIEHVQIKNYLKSEDPTEFKHLLLLDNSNLILIFPKSSLLNELEDEIKAFQNELLIIVLDKKPNSKFKIEELEKEESNEYINTMKIVGNLLDGKLDLSKLPETFKTEKEYYHYLTSIIIKQVYKKSLHIGYLDLLQMLSAKNEFLIKCQNQLLTISDLKTLLLFSVIKT